MTDFLPLYRQMAAGGQQFRGLTLLNHRKEIARLIRSIGAVTVLDYGCGAAEGYNSYNKVHHDWGIKRQNVTLYDPSFPKLDKKPTGHFDLVICSDVLEHIPEDQVDEFVKTLFSHAVLGVWASVCCRPAKKCFPGTEINLHCTVKHFTWWQDTFREHANGTPFELVETP